MKHLTFISRVVNSTHSDVTDLLASQVPQLLAQGSEQFGLLLWKLRNQLLQKGPDLRETAARSDPNTWRGARRSANKSGRFGAEES